MLPMSAAVAGTLLIHHAPHACTLNAHATFACRMPHPGKSSKGKSSGARGKEEAWSALQAKMGSSSLEDIAELKAIERAGWRRRNRWFNDKVLRDGYSARFGKMTLEDMQVGGPVPCTVVLLFLWHAAAMEGAVLYKYQYWKCLSYHCREPQGFLKGHWCFKRVQRRSGSASSSSECTVAHRRQEGGTMEGGGDRCRLQVPEEAGQMSTTLCDRSLRPPLFNSR